MDYLTFEPENFDFDFMGDEDFGLAKSFTSAPMH
jgi:20S proteasome subunit beta 5